MTLQRFTQRQNQRSQDQALLTQVLDSISDRIAGGRRRPAPDNYLISARIAEEEQGILSDPYSVEDNWKPQTHVRVGNQSWGNHANGRIPLEEMRQVADGMYLRTDAASAFGEMAAAALKDGIVLRLSSAYRDYDHQHRIWSDPTRDNVAARPGHSNHGWGVSIDVKGADARRWVQTNGEKYGFIWPNWAREADSYEPWHFNYVGAFRETPDPQMRWEPIGEGDTTHVEDRRGELIRGINDSDLEDLFALINDDLIKAGRAPFDEETIDRVWLKAGPLGARDPSVGLMTPARIATAFAIRMGWLDEDKARKRIQELLDQLPSSAAIDSSNTEGPQ